MNNKVILILYLTVQKKKKTLKVQEVPDIWYHLVAYSAKELDIRNSHFHLPPVLLKEITFILYLILSATEDSLLVSEC